MKNDSNTHKKIFHPWPLVSLQLISTASIGSSFLSITIYDTKTSLHPIMIPGIISANNPKNNQGKNQEICKNDTEIVLHKSFDQQLKIGFISPNSLDKNHVSAIIKYGLIRKHIAMPLIQKMQQKHLMTQGQISGSYYSLNHPS